MVINWDIQMLALRVISYPLAHDFIGMLNCWENTKPSWRKKAMI
jgi:hypothetical protein